ncbi:MAG: hypothetical protein AB1726_00380 [Planctomycetota bacterium]
MLTAQWTPGPSHEAATRAGLRLGDRGTHSSRTIMLAELRELLSAVPTEAGRESYAEAIVRDNALGKATTSSRRLTNQRLGELYGLDPSLPLFRVFRRVWAVDEPGRPLLALLCALARDPLLRASAEAVLSLAPGAELIRGALIKTLRQATGSRLNDAILDKVARNAGSSWSQAGHLEGRVRKIRRLVEPTPGSVAFVVWLGSLQRLSGEDLLRTPWARVLDRSPAALLDLALRAKQLGLLQARSGGNVIEIDARGLDPFERAG